jgi:hypothetical protein
MNKVRFAILALAILMAAESSVRAQSQYIGYVYPAGGQQGATFSLKLGGQSLNPVTDVVVSGEGVSVRVVDYYRVMDNQELGLVSQQLAELQKKEITVDDAMAAKMASFEFPTPIGPDAGGDAARYLICPICGSANPADAKFCVKCKAKLDHAILVGGSAPKSEPSKSEKEAGKQKLIERIQKRFAEDERDPAVPSQAELVFAEVTVAPDAKPGRREIRVVTKSGVSNPLPFYVGQVPEVTRKPMKTMQKPYLGKESLSQRHRPLEEEELRVTVPCTMNGQVAAGEVNRYRFQASKGQRLVIAAKAQQLVPYVPDGVPGWFQAVLRLTDSNGKELAYNDDFHFHPDPLIYFEVPEDGEYVLAINEALYRGRESFVYRITVGELPFVTSIFPLGGRVGEPVKIEMSGWNLEKTTLAPPPKDAKAGCHLIAATTTDGTLVSNYVPFALDTLPECLEQEPNDEPAKAQKIQLPIIVNGRIDRPGDWDVFAVEGKAGETIVAEVYARRLGSPLDSFLKVTGADGKIIAMNDDHYDAGSGLNTSHADSYLMLKLPADGKYFIHLGDTTRHGGKEYAYRLRISRPQPDFALRLIPSRIVIPSKGAAAVTVFAIRKDGYSGPIQLNFKDLPKGFESPGATLGAGQEVVGLALKTSLTAIEKPVNLTVVGTAKADGREIVHDGVPAEDKMQAFLWRHLLPADTLPVLVFDPSIPAPTDRIRPPIRDQDRPKNVTPTLTRSSVEWYLAEVERLYQEWFLTDDFANREIAGVEARVIK